MAEKVKTIIHCQDCGAEIVKYYLPSTLKYGNITRYCKDCLSKRMVKFWLKNPRLLKEDKHVDKMGYIHIRVEGILIPEHRFVMEQKLGRKLTKGEIVHHIDSARANNSPDNLELWVRSHSINGSRASQLICPHCGQNYLTPP